MTVDWFTEPGVSALTPSAGRIQSRTDLKSSFAIRTFMISDGPPYIEVTLASVKAEEIGYSFMYP